MMSGRSCCGSSPAVAGGCSDPREQVIRPPQHAELPSARRRCAVLWLATGSLQQHYRGPVRGDRVEIVIDAGGEVRTYEITATRNGRRVEINTGRGIVEVTEVTRGGTPVRTARFMSSRILALVEHPAGDHPIGQEVMGVDERHS
jgi:hypothetical protein